MSSEVTSPQRALCFDIGIKNLAWCLLEKRGITQSCLSWDNQNLLSEGSNVSAKKNAKCPHCKAKGVYEVEGTALVCSRHCPPTKPPLRDGSGNLLKKLPSVEVCKTLCTARGLTQIPKKKDDLIALLKTVYSFPETQKKVSRAPDAGLEDIHNSLRNVVVKNAELWKTASLIGLENQPAFKNPTMKSVQMLLFATLRDVLQPQPPKIRLIHASKKVKEATKGDAGQKERKAGSEKRVEDLFAKADGLSNAAEWKGFWTAAGKKSDLADAMCMSLDQLATA